MNPRFGPAGNSESFYLDGNKSSVEAPKWLNSLGLDAYEYQCNKGVNIGVDKAKQLGAEAEKYSIQLSIHAPYYINLSSLEEDKIDNSIKYIIDSMQIGKVMGAKRVVVHTGATLKNGREAALEIAKNTISKTIEKIKQLDLYDIHICPETMGKYNQLGTLEEVIELCKIDDNLLPTIDFGHLHARDLGRFKTIGDYEEVFEKMENGLGSDKLKDIHIHYSRIEFTDKGEKKHWSYNNTEYGPEFEPIAELIYRKSMRPVIICESRNTMAEDAVKLKTIYFNKVKGD